MSGGSQASVSHHPGSDCPDSGHTHRIRPVIAEGMGWYVENKRHCQRGRESAGERQQLQPSLRRYFIRLRRFFLSGLPDVQR